MKFLESYPSSKLTPYVKSFWCMKGKLETGYSVVSRDIPNGDLYLIFNFGSSLIQRNSFGQAIEYDKSIVREQQRSALQLEQIDDICLFGISFYPWGIYPFIEGAVHEFSDALVPAENILRSFPEEELYKKSFQEQKNLAETWLLNKLTAEKRISPVVISTATYLMNLKGSIQIRKLSEKYNISMKHLERTFSEVTGIIPKQFARLQRINGVIEHLKINIKPDWIGLAEHFQFYDQSHFSKEFKSHTGTTPTQFLQAKDTIFENYNSHLEII